MAVGKARGSGAAGRSPGVRPVPEQVLPRMSVDGNGERSRGGRGAEGDCKAVLVLVLGAEAVEEDMLREARNGARGEKSRGGAHTVGEGKVVSHERRYSRGGRRNTIVLYRSMPLRGERKR